MSCGALVHADDMPAEHRAPGASTRNLLATGSAGPQLARRLVDVATGAGFDGAAGPGGELWFVIAGAGRLGVTDQPGLPVTADRALWIPPGARYQLRADGPVDLQIDAMALPAADADPAGRGGSAGRAGRPAATGPALARDLRDCEVETTGNRKFRVLFGPGLGCAVATQFLGEIPAGRAPDHSHPYDELVLVLAGQGVLHTSLGDHAIRAGSCAHLPPGQRHCLENTRLGDVARARRVPSRRQPGGQEQLGLNLRDGPRSGAMAAEPGRGLRYVHAMQPEQVLAEDLPLGLIGQLRVPVPGAQVLGDLEVRFGYLISCQQVSSRNGSPTWKITKLMSGKLAAAPSMSQVWVCSAELRAAAADLSASAPPAAQFCNGISTVVNDSRN